MANTLNGAQEQDVIRLSGNVDLEHSPGIRKTLLDAVAHMRNVFVDLSEVTYIDSSGIACLVEALQSARNHDADLGLVSVSIQAMRVLELARLDMVFSIHEDLASALKTGK
jgi:anti-sigma B factor antagonist